MEKTSKTKDIFDETFNYKENISSTIYNFTTKQIITRLSDLNEKPNPFYDWNPKTDDLSKALIKNGYKKGNQPYGLITSNLQLQSLNNLPAILSAFYHSLKTDGLFMGVMLCDNSLNELTKCIIEAEVSINNKIYPRTIPMIGTEIISSYLLQSSFTNIVLDKEKITMTFKDAWSLMKALRSMGMTNNLKDRSRHFTRKDIFEKTNELYKQNYSTKDGGIFATFELLFLHGWKE